MDGRLVARDYTGIFDWDPNTTPTETAREGGSFWNQTRHIHPLQLARMSFINSIPATITPKDITATYCVSIVNGKENRVWKSVWNTATEHNIIQLEGEGKARLEAHNPTATPSKARGRKEDKHRRNKPRSDSSTR